MTEPIGQRLEALRLSLLRLHKVLLDHERSEYEKLNGPVPNPGRLLSLVMSDPFFDWLHTISKTIVRIDEIQDDEKSSDAQAEEIFLHVKRLVLPGEKETEFTRQYKKSLQKNAAAVLCHAAVLKTIYDD